jgi:DNA-directed RNA polymerase specialized sigma24 family protein
MGTNQRRTTSTTSVQPRQRKGTRDGGKYAPILNPESSVQLVDHNVDADMDGVAETQRLARHFIRRYGLHDHTVNGYMDADDLTQDAVLAYLVASQTERPEGVELPVGVIAKRSIIRALDSGTHRSKGDHSAMKLLDESGSSREPRDNFLQAGAQSVMRTRSVQAKGRRR